MIDLISKIKNSEPTIAGEEASNLFVAIMTNPDWVVISSAVHGLDKTIEHSAHFVSTLARIEVHGESLLTFHPIHIAYAENLNDGWDRMWGLLYSNGAVCYSEKDDGAQFVILFMDETLADPNAIREIPIDFSGENLLG